MNSKETIKVFISSKCGGERTSFDKLVQAEASDKKNIADTAVRTNYDLVRRALKIALENTGIIETYVFEDDFPSTSSSSEDFLFQLDRSDICLFLIDNFDKEIPKGVLAEVDRAKQTNKKSIYLFLKDNEHDVTEIQKSLKGGEGRHYYVISDIREFIDVGYKAVIADIIKTYQKYCRDNFSENIKETSSVEVTVESFPTDKTDIDKQIFKNLGLTKNKIISLMYRPDDKDIQTSNLDSLCLDVISFLLGDKEFKDVNLENLLRELSAIQSPGLHEIIAQRWKVISSFYTGDLESALSISESIFNTFSKDTSVPKWLLNDVLIDWRNLQIVDDEIKDVYRISVQEKINQQNSLVFFPLVDRFSTNINNDIWDRNFDEFTGSPYSTKYYNLEHLFGYISNYLFSAIYYGSFTHIVLTLKEIQKALFDVVQKENNLLHKIQLMKISILQGDESSFNKIVSKYGSSLSHSTTMETLRLYEIAGTKPLRYGKTKWKMILFREFGYYFSDTDYEIISNEILNYSRQWMRDEKVNIFLGEKIFKALKSNIRRLSQETILVFLMEVLDKKYFRFFDSVFEILANLDFSSLPEELIKRFLSQIDILLSRKDKKRDYQHVESFLIRIRKGQGNFNAEIDRIVEELYPEFYKREYNLEVFPEKRDVHIQRYVEVIKARNKTQGKNGRFTGFLDRPYHIIRRIIELEKPFLSPELLDDLLEVILNTLRLKTQSHSEKIDAIQLMLTLKTQKLLHNYNWRDYYSQLEQYFSEIEESFSGFFIKDETLSLRLHLIFIRIIFDVDCLQEFLETLALINNSDEYEIISSLVALNDFLSLEENNLFEKPVMPMLVQYVSAFCFHESSEIRYRTVEALYSLIESRYADFVVGRLSKMMDNDDDHKVRWVILSKVSLIKNVNEATYNYIIGKAKIDNNYLVRRIVELPTE